MRYPPQSIGHQIEFLEQFAGNIAHKCQFHPDGLITFGGVDTYKVEWDEYHRPTFLSLRNPSDDPEIASAVYDQLLYQYELIENKLSCEAMFTLKQLCRLHEEGKECKVQIVSNDLDLFMPYVFELIKCDLVYKIEDFLCFDHSVARDGRYAKFEYTFKPCPFAVGFVKYLAESRLL